MELKLTEYSNIIYVGDLHGEFNEFVQSTKDCTNSLYILTGDLGLGCKKRDIEIDDFSKAEYILASNNNYVIIIRGNIIPLYILKIIQYCALAVRIQLIDGIKIIGIKMSRLLSLLRHFMKILKRIIFIQILQYLILLHYFVHLQNLVQNQKNKQVYHF